MNRTAILSKGKCYAVSLTASALTNPTNIAALGRAAHVTLGTGACSVNTYPTAEECRALAHLFLGLACDIDRKQLSDEALAQALGEAV